MGVQTWRNRGRGEEKKGGEREEKRKKGGKQGKKRGEEIRGKRILLCFIVRGGGEERNLFL